MKNIVSIIVLFASSYHISAQARVEIISDNKGHIFQGLKNSKSQKHFRVPLERKVSNSYTLRNAKINTSTDYAKIKNGDQKSSWFDIDRQEKSFVNEVKDFMNAMQNRHILKDSEQPNKMNDISSINDFQKHPKVEATMAVVLENYMNTQYYGPIYVGTPGQEMTVVYDTGSDWLVIEAHICSTCLENTYDHMLSTTYNIVDQDLVEHLYGSAALYGYDVTDRVSLDSADTTGVDSFEFFSIHDQTGLNENIDGILGMSRGMATDEYTSGPLYIEYLYTNGQIDDKIMSFYMTLQSDSIETYVDIGNMDESAFYGGSSTAAGLVWIAMPTYIEILYWFAQSTAIRFGDADDTKSVSYTFEEYIPAIFDTGTSLVLVPGEIGPDFFGRLLEGQRYVYAAGMYQISCEHVDEFQSIYILIDGYWLEFHPDDYVIQITESGITGCLLGFASNDIMPYWLLGDAFLRGYYSVHDMTNDRIGFAPHATSNKKIITEGTNPSLTYNQAFRRKSWLYQSMSWGSILTGWATVPIFLIIFGLGSFCFTCMICIYICFTIDTTVSSPADKVTENVKNQVDNLQRKRFASKKQNKAQLNQIFKDEDSLLHELSTPIRNINLQRQNEYDNISNSLN